MKIQAKIVRRSDDHSYLWKAGDVAEVKLDEIEPCCSAMRQAWDDRAIHFGEFDSMLNKNANVNIYTCAPYPEGAVWAEYAIAFCPFCGEAIQIALQDPDAAITATNKD